MSLKNIILVNLLIALTFSVSCKTYKFYGSPFIIKNAVKNNSLWKKFEHDYSLDKPADLKRLIQKHGVRKSTFETKKFVYKVAGLYDAIERTLSSAILLSRSAFLVADGSLDEKIILKYSQKTIESFNGMQWEQDPVAAYYYALGVGGVFRVKGLSAITKLPDVLKAMKIAIKKPETDYYGPARIYGMLYLKAPQWPKGIGDIDKALKYLKIAAVKYPDFPQNTMFYAEALVEDEMTGDARKYLQIASRSISSKDWGSFYAKVWKHEIAKLQKSAAE